MTQTNAAAEVERAVPLPGPAGLYARFAVGAAVCGLGVGVACLVEARETMFFIPVAVLALVVPIGGGAALAGCGLAAARGSRRSFYASWALAAVLLIPASIFVYVLVVGRQPVGLLAEAPDLRTMEAVGLALLTASFVCLVAVVGLGFRVRAGLRRGA